MTNFVVKSNGREAMRVTGDGVTLHYTYPEEDNKIPEGMRRVTYLEPAEQSNLTLDPKSWTVGCPGNTCDKTIDITLQNEGEEAMTKNFIEVGGTYKSKNGSKWDCLFIKGDHAWLVLNGDYGKPAFVFKLDGTPVTYPDMKGYQLLPPKPKIEKNDANLWCSANGHWRIFSQHHHDEDINGKLYTHPKAGVALFVPLNMDYETLSKAIYALQDEIVG